MIIDAKDDTITLSGDIKTNIWAAIQAAAAILLKENTSGIIIDCEKVESITGEGMQTFADAFKYITRKNARIIFASPTREITELSKTIEGVRSKMPVADSALNARKSLNIYNIDIKSGHADNQILIPLIKDWRRSLELSLELFNSKDYDLHLIAVILVPRSVSYSSPLPEMEAKALADLAEAEKFLKSHSKSQVFKEIIRARTYFEALDKFSVLKNTPMAVLSDNSPYIEKYYDNDNLAMYMSGKSYVPVLTSFLDGFGFKPKNILVPYMSDFKTALRTASSFIHTGKEKIFVPYPLIIPRKFGIDEYEPVTDKIEEIKRNAESFLQRNRRESQVSVFPLPLRTLSEGISLFVEKNQIDLLVTSLNYGTREHRNDFDFVNYMFLNNVCSLISMPEK